MKNIMIASSVFLFREGLKSILKKNNNFILQDEITNKKEFWNKLKISQPDILVIDIDQRNFILHDDIDMINEVSPLTKILVISENNKKDIILKAIKNGVLGYLTKECDENEILIALNSLSRGEKFFCNKILNIILEEKIEEPKNEAELTKREIEIIRLIAEKYSNQEIADKLFISIHTVYTHRKNIMKKLKLKSPVELILYAIDSGII
ncbi:MAG: response regulator transcription factor [Melioribacter sp.]|uniref:response regulator transcription factor n=1 Tax=Rosettibacter primus TaxID=3111523 RepID=UPI00247C2E3B|nr:response regulator transcription factor [Melioribacter sp.]